MDLFPTEKSAWGKTWRSALMKQNRITSVTWTLPMPGVPQGMGYNKDIITRVRAWILVVQWEITTMAPIHWAISAWKHALYLVIYYLIYCTQTQGNECYD